MTSEPITTSEDQIKKDQRRPGPTILEPRQSTNFSERQREKSEERVIPLVGEKITTSKKAQTDYVIIRKIPVTETKTIQVPVAYEKVVVERRPRNGKKSLTVINSRVPC